MNHRFVTFALASLLSVAATAAGQDLITVDVTSVVADVSRKPIGINVNFLLDDDANRPYAIDALAAALKKAGVKYLRYPGGEKSDAYLWAVPPYAVSAPTLARWAAGEYPQNQEWPSYDRNLVESDGRTFKVAPLDFDEFMAVCREIDCVPTIVVCYDSMYKPAQTGGVAPSRAQLIETAREWVRYANVAKGYNVKYWEIGNESWLPHYNGSATAANYARDLVDFSRAMKAVDPTILIGANGESDTWWRTVLTGASSAIDFLAIHNYPAMNWGSFTYYQQNNVNLMRPVQTAQAAIKAYAPAVDRERLTIASTEINSADWSGAWPHRNDLGHAIVLFDLLGAHLANPNVAFAQLWNTRWSGNDTATTPVLWDALDKNNDLQATGRVTSIWGQFLKDKLVSSSSTTKVRTYTTYSPASGKLSVFLINKDSVPRSASVTINGGGSGYSVSTWVFSGSGAEDVRPIWQHEGESSNTGNVISATLPPVSLTVLDLAPDGVVHPIPGTVEAEDFRAGGSWDSTSGNAGGVYRATDVDIQVTSDVGAGFNVAWIAAGESLEYALYVAKAGYYGVSARVASPYAGKWFQVLLDGQDVTGNIGVPTTGAWQKWQTVTAAGVYIPAGTHRMMFSTPSGGFNLNWLALSASARRTPTVPGIIQAEDFLEGSYWDATSGNYGGVYRATDVDVQTSSDTGGGFNVGWVAAGEWLDYAFDVPTAGYYDLSARVASPLSGKSIAVRLDGSDLPGNVAIPNTGAWQNWQTVTRTGIYLSSGPHRIRITAVTDGFNLNWLSLTAATLTSPARRIEIEAENFDDGAYWDSTSGNLGAAYRATDVDIQPTSDVGGGFNVAWIAPGEWQEYAIQVITPGAYDLSARVASPHSGKSFYVLLDGKDVTGAIAVPTTGGYQSWQTVTRPSIYLTAGTHRLRLVANTSGFNLNWLALAPTP